MGREIKFRGKRIDNGEWIYGCVHVIDTLGNGYTGMAIQVQRGAARPFSVQVDTETVGQYTGLKDRNGKEIYEGDILENNFSSRDDFCYRCMWYEEIGQWMFDPFMKGNKDAPLLGIEEFLQDWETVGIENASTVEVIGNIYENPELLEGGEQA